jgi:hypothetical protein
MRKLALLSTLAIGALGALGASSATAGTIWNLDIHHAETNFVPGGGAGYVSTHTLTEGAVPSTNEVQRIDRVLATAGTYRLTFGASTTPHLPFDASVGEVQSALQALPSIGAGNVTVGGTMDHGASGGDPHYKITFAGALAATNVPQIIAAAGSPRLSIAPELWLDVNNVGDTASSGVITVTINLPKGLTRASIQEHRTEQAGGYVKWTCPGSPGDAKVTCTTGGSIARHAVNESLRLALSVSGTLKEGSTPIVQATVQGGGAIAQASALEKLEISGDPVPFEIPPDSFNPGFLAADESTPITESGAHPELLVTPFDFSTIAAPNKETVLQKEPAGSVRNVHVDLPQGFLGDPTAVGECSQAQFTLNLCPASSQVGRIELRLSAADPGFTGPDQTWIPFHIGVFNLVHPRGAITDLGFSVGDNPVHIKASLDPANNYAITTTVPDINETIPALTQKLTIWGIPADHSHDSERCPEFFISSIGSPTGDTSKECATDHERKPFLTVPFRCGVDNTFRIHHYDSWQDSGAFGPDINKTTPQATDCDRPRFEPDVEIVPTGKQANTPTGLDVHVKIAQNENPDALATPPVKRFTVRLPEGMSFSPSFADGLKSCTLAQMKLGTNEPIECPDSARIGEVELSTPLLPERAEGSMYLAAQRDNPFGSTFAMLLVLHDTEERGVLVKIPGRIDVDPVTGQITTVFDDTPQFPFDDLTLKFRSGPRAPLINPPACGTHTIGVEVASYAQPQDPVDASNAYEVTEGPNGTPCPPDSARRPFSPRFSGGTLNPVAGTYSPFLFRMTRTDDEQELSQVTSILPPGLVAKIAGVSLCPDQAIASISTAEGTGINELNSPACPASSQIGSVSAGLGAGPGPNYFDGKVYLAGPYKGAQLSLAVVAPGIAGPFDLGNVVVRAALYVNPETAQVRAVSDPFPTILHGVILRARDIRLRVDRPQTTINPTNCSPMSVDGQITGVGGSLQSTADDSLFNASSPFQVGSCSDLSFKPKLSFRLFGGTRRGAHPKLQATVTMPPGGANIAAASVALPRSEFLDQGHIKTICTRVQFKDNACPAGSIYGTVSAKTPLLDETLSGPVYLRSSSNKLPDLVATFRGGRIDANLVGRIDSVNGGIRNTFDFVPDVPVSSATFSFFGGKKGLLVNSRNLCIATSKATAKFTAQNGDKLTLRPELKNACAKAKKSKRRAKRR